MMKTIKRLSVSTVLGLLALAVMIGCEKTDYEAEDNILKDKPANSFSAAISGIDLPVRIEAGKPATFLVNYEMPNPCSKFIGFTVQQHGDTIMLEAFLLLSQDYCIEVIAQGQDEFKRTIALPGTYHLKFSFWGEIRTLSFEVH